MSFEYLDISNKQLAAITNDNLKPGLRGLNASSNKFTTFPKLLLSQTSIVALNLANNQISNFPAEVEGVEELKFLHLAANKLPSIPPEIHQLNNLKILLLDTNQLTRFPEGILEIYQLEELSLNENQISEVPVGIQKLTNLRILSMARNQITGSLPIEVWTLPSLVWVSFSMNQITHLIPPSFSIALIPASPVEHLFVSFNNLTTVPVFPTVKVFHAKYNSITQIPPELVSLPNLYELEFEGNPLPHRVARLASHSENFIAYLKSPTYLQDLKEAATSHDDRKTDALLTNATAEWIDLASNKTKELVAGTTYNLLIHAMNYYNSPQNMFGDKMSCILHSHKGDVQCTVAQQNTGQYAATVTPTASGIAMIIVKKDSMHISGSPWELHVLAGPTSAATCLVVGLVDSMRCLPSTFYLVAKDQFSNPKLIGGDSVVATLSESANNVESIHINPIVKDLKDGTYSIQYTPTILGKCLIEISVNDVALLSAPFTVTIGPGPTSAGHCVLVLDNLRGAFAGADWQFTIIPKDAFNNVQPRMEGETFVASFTGPAPLQASVVQGPDGTHTASFHPTIAGKYTTQVSLQKPDKTLAQVGGSPFQIEIDAGPVYAQNCKAVGKGLEAGKVGEEGAFKITAFDKFANPIRRGGDKFEISIVGPITVTVNPVDCGDGSYNVSYNITKAGPYKIAVSVKGAQITGSPFSVVLVEGDTHPSKTVISGATDGICGIESLFTIQAHDIYGNPRKRGGDKFSVTLHPPQSDKGGAGVVRGDVKDTGNGTYEVRYTASLAGLYQGEVILGDLGNVAGSPFRIKQQPGAPFAAKCVVQGQSPQNGTAGVTAEFVVQLKDKFGNPCENASAASLDVKTAVKDDKNALHSVTPAITDNKNGTLTVAFAPTISGVYTTQVSVILKGSVAGGGAMSGSPFTTTIVPGPCDPSKVEIYTVAGREGVLPLGKCTSPFVFGIRAVDKYGNFRKSGRDIFRVQMSLVSSSASAPPSAGPVSLQGLVTDNGDGTYTANLTPTTSGVYSVQVVHENTPIRNSPFTATVEAGLTEASACSATFQKVGTIVAGVQSQFQIFAKDAFANQRMSGGDKFIAVLLPKNVYDPKGKETEKIYANVVDCGNGTYDVAFTAFVACDMTLHVTLEKGSSQHIAGSPVNVRVESGVVDPSKCETAGLISTEPGKDILFQAGVSFSFIVIARDSYSNKTRKGTDGMAVTMQGGNAPSSTLPMLDNNDGTFSVSYSVETSGKYYVSVVVDQMPIYGCPFSIFVNGGPSFAPNCSASGPALTTATSGAVGFFIVTTRDKYNNIRTVSDTINVFQVQITYPNQNLPGTQQIPTKVLDNKDGTYRIEYTPSIAGECDVRVTLSGSSQSGPSGQHIHGSPFRVKVGPGQVFPAKCEAFGPGLQGGKAGKNLEFTIQTRDYYSNLLDFGGFLWHVKAKAPVDTVTINPTVQDKRDGTYLCSFYPTLAGKYMISVLASKDGSLSLRDDEGIHVIGSPFRILIVPAEASPYTCKTTGAGISGGYAGDLALFKILSCDEFGNQLTIGGDIYDVKVSGPTTPNVLATDNNDGTYLVKYLPNKSGTYMIHISLRDVSIPGSPFRCLIEDKPS